MSVSRHILEQYRHSALRAVTWLKNHLNKEGSYQLSPQDLACYYKSPYLFFLSGHGQESHRVLDFISRVFMQPNGDFSTSPEMKSENNAFIEYWSYMNGWIAIAAQKMGRFEVAYPAFHYLQSFYHPVHGGFTTQQAYGLGDNTVDIFTTAHLGLVSLYFGDLTKPSAAGNLLHRFLGLQPNLEKEFLLRINKNGALISSFHRDHGLFYTVSFTEPNQTYFMLGYPIAFLGKLYDATGNEIFLQTAKECLDQLVACTGNLRTFHLSHKVAWGSAIIARITKERRYMEFTQNIVEHLLSIQDQNGGWLQDQPTHMRFDQTAEIAIWLIEIANELSALAESNPEVEP